jgi:hypothetical protein
MMRKLQVQEADARVDSAIAAIHENNKTRDQVTGPRHQEATDRVFDHRYTNSEQEQDWMIPGPQEWIFELEADKEGIDRVNVTIDHQLQQEPTESR